MAAMGAATMMTQSRRSPRALTLATFDGPGNAPAEARWLIVRELGSAILLVIGIFAMLINRISEF